MGVIFGSTGGGINMGAKEKNEIRILVVDDEVEIADTFRDILSDAGYAATQAYDGREALDKFRAGDFHLVVTDIKMPGIDGIELLETIKMIDKKVEVIIFTGYGSIESVKKALKLGAYDYLEKPVQKDKFLITVEHALERNALSKQLGVFKGMSLALIISIPLWMILGIVLAFVWR